MLRVIIDASQLSNARRGLEALRTIGIDEGLRDSGHILVPALKAETPVGKSPRGKATHGSGRSLAGSTSARIAVVGGKQGLQITQNARTAEGVSYGIFVREGTKPHDIAPRNGKALRFFVAEGSAMFGRASEGFKSHGIWMGAIFTKRVHHPGTKANPYHLRAIEKSLDAIKTAFTAALKRALSTGQ